MLKAFAGAAVPTTITTSILSTDTSVTIANASGWTFTDPFVIVLDRGTPQEEKILCSVIAGNVVNFLTRGYDGTTAFGHNTGATALHALDSVTVREANAHVNQVTRDDHTQYLRADGARPVTGVMTFNVAPVMAGGLDISGAVDNTAYTDEIRLLGTAGATHNHGIVTAEVGTPHMRFDHRGVGNNGDWIFGNGTNGGVARVTIAGSTGHVTLNTGGLAVNGSPSGYTGAEVTTPSTVGLFFTTTGAGAPDMGFHHRAGAGTWSWANGTNAAVTQMTLGATGILKLTQGTAMVDLSSSGATDASGGVGTGDKIGFYSGVYGMGVQASRMVAYMPAGAAFAVRTYSATGQKSSGVDAITLQSDGRGIFTAGVDVTGGPDGYGGQLRLGGTAANQLVGISSQSVTSPQMLFDHRATGNTGSWVWRNGTVAGAVRMTLDATGNLTVGSAGAYGTITGYQLNLVQAGGGVRDLTTGNRALYFDGTNVYLGAVDGTRETYLRAAGNDQVRLRSNGVTEFQTGAGAGTHEATRVDAHAIVSGTGFSYACDFASHQGGAQAGISVAINRSTPAVTINNAGGDHLRSYSGTQQQHTLQAGGHVNHRGQARIGANAYGDVADGTDLWIYAVQGDAGVYLTAEGGASYPDVSLKLRSKGNGALQGYVSGGGTLIWQLYSGIARTQGYEHYLGQGAFGLAHAQFDVYADVGASDVWLRAQSGNTLAFDRNLMMRGASLQHYNTGGTSEFAITDPAGAGDTALWLYWQDWSGVAYWRRVTVAPGSSIRGGTVDSHYFLRVIP